jgi:hypothetical protein
LKKIATEAQKGDGKNRKLKEKIKNRFQNESGQKLSGSRFPLGG